MFTKEIEKKFLLDFIPTDLNIESTKTVYQSYLATGKEEIRVRKTENDKEKAFVMTIKRGSGLSREEFEFSIEEETYNQLLTETNKPIIKTRHKVIIENNKFDLDVFHNVGKEVPLKTIEIEFSNEEESKNFIKPEWFGKDVTNEPFYKNQNLWHTIQS